MVKQQGSLFGHGDRDKRIQIRNFIRVFEPSRAESAAVVQSVYGKRTGQSAALLFWVSCWCVVSFCVT